MELLYTGASTPYEKKPEQMLILEKEYLSRVQHYTQFFNLDDYLVDLQPGLFTDFFNFPIDFVQYVVRRDHPADENIEEEFELIRKYINMWKSDEPCQYKEEFKEFCPKEYEALVKYFSVSNPLSEIQKIQEIIIEGCSVDTSSLRSFFGELLMEYVKENIQQENYKPSFYLEYIKSIILPQVDIKLTNDMFSDKYIQGVNQQDDNQQDLNQQGVNQVDESDDSEPNDPLMRVNPQYFQGQTEPQEQPQPEEQLTEEERQILQEVRQRQQKLNEARNQPNPQQNEQQQNPKLQQDVQMLYYNKARLVFNCLYIFVPTSHQQPAITTDIIYKIFHMRHFDDKPIVYFPMTDNLFKQHEVIGKMVRKAGGEFEIQRIYNSHSYSMPHQTGLGSCQFHGFKNAMFFEYYKHNFDIDVDPNIYYEFDDIEDDDNLITYYNFNVLQHFIMLFLNQHNQFTSYLPYCFDSSDNFLYSMLFNHMRQKCIQYKINFDKLIDDIDQFLDKGIKQKIQIRFLKFQIVKFLRIVSNFSIYQNAETFLIEVRRRIISSMDGSDTIPLKKVWSILRERQDFTKLVRKYLVKSIDRGDLSEYAQFYDRKRHFEDVYIEERDLQFFQKTLAPFRHLNISVFDQQYEIFEKHMKFLTYIQQTLPDELIDFYTSQHQAVFDSYQIMMKQYTSAHPIFVYFEYPFDQNKYPIKYVSVHKAPALYEKMKEYSRYFKLNTDIFSAIDEFNRRTDLSNRFKKDILKQFDLNHVFETANRILDNQTKQIIFEKIIQKHDLRANRFEELLIKRKRNGTLLTAREWYEIQVIIFDNKPKILDFRLVEFISSQVKCNFLQDGKTLNGLFQDDSIFKGKYEVLANYRQTMNKYYTYLKHIPLKGYNANNFYKTMVNQIIQTIGPNNFWSKVLQIEVDTVDRSEGVLDVDHLYRVREYLKIIDQKNHETLSLEEPSYKLAYDKLCRKEENADEAEQLRTTVMRKVNSLAELFPKYSTDELQVIGINLFYLQNGKQ